MKFTNSAICFSNNCGMCDNCCSNTIDKFNNKQFDKKEEENKRERDLSKLLGKKNIEEITKSYDKQMIEWCKKYQYIDPYCYGWAPEKIKKENYPENIQNYQLILNLHKENCDDLYCRMIYENSDSWTHKTRFPKLPLYKRILNVNNLEQNYLCALCVNR